MNEREIFIAASQISDLETRTSFLDSACQGNLLLRHRVETLLNAELAAANVVDRPAQMLQWLAAETSEQVEPSPDDSSSLSPVDHPDPFLKVDSFVGPYLIKQRLGEGGMGVVYVARQEKPVKRLVAIKILKPGENSRNVLARFEQERHALALMDHLNIAKVLDAGTTSDGRPFFVMELVKGIPVNDYCDRENLSLGERLNLFLPICAAVHHAHQKGIIHRDLKPSNILVALYDGRPIPKVIDFGVAKACGFRLTAESLYTEVGSIVGTIEYMAPEQAELNNLDIDIRADVYSLGVILYELLTGSQPFSRNELRNAAFDEMLRMIREVEPQKPSTKLSSSNQIASIAAHRKLEPKQLARSVSGDLDWVVMKAMAKERIRRYQSASDLSADITRFLNHEPVAAGPPSTLYRLRKFTRRNRSAVLATSLVALAIFIASVVSFWQTVRVTHAWQITKQALESESESRILAETARTASEVARQEAESAREKEIQARNAAETERDRASAAEKVAKNDRAVAEATVKFLHDDLLAQADPLLEPDRDLKLRTLLDRAAATIAGRFDAAPLVEASIRQLIGDIYESLGEYDLARVHLERAREINQQQLDSDDARCLVNTNSLARLEMNQGHYQLSEQLFREGLEAAEKTVGENHPNFFIPLNGLAILFRKSDRIGESFPLFEKSLRLSRANLGNESNSTLSTLINYGSALEAAGRYREAKSTLDQARRLCQKVLGPEHPFTLVATHNLIEVLSDLGEHDLAITLAKENWETRNRVLGKHHPYTLSSEAMLGEVYRNKGDFELAKKYLESAYAGFCSVLGKDHVSTMSRGWELAAVYQKLAEYESAEKLLLDIISIRRQQFGADSVTALTAEASLAVVYKDTRRFDLAEPLFQKVISGYREQLGPNHVKTQSITNNLAVMFQNQEKYDLAQPLLESVYETRNKTLGKNDPKTLTSLNNLGVNQYGSRQFESAEKTFRDVVERRTALLGSQHPDTSLSKINLADVLFAMGKLDQAIEIYGKALPDLQQALPATHPTVRIAINKFADAEASAGKYAEAAAHRRTLLELTQQVAAEDSIAVANIRLLLGSDLFNLGRLEEAEEVLRRSLAVREGSDKSNWMLNHNRVLLGITLVQRLPGLSAENSDQRQSLYDEVISLLPKSIEELELRGIENQVVQRNDLRNGILSMQRLCEAFDRTEDAVTWRTRLEKLAQENPSGEALRQ